MSEKKIPATKVVFGATKGKPVRFAYVHAHESHLNTESGKMEWSTLLMIPKENTEDIAAANAAIEEQKRLTWLDEKTKKLMLPPKFWNPLIDPEKDVKQNGKPWGEEFAGHYLINAKSEDDGDKEGPEVKGTTRDEKGKFVDLGPKEIKSGDWGRASVNFKAYIKGTGGVGSYLNSLQKTRVGEAMSSRASAEDDYGSYEDDLDEEDDPLMK